MSFNSSTLAESDTQLQFLPGTQISQDEEKSKRMQRLLAVLRNNAEISLFATQTDGGDKQPLQILTPLKAENSAALNLLPKGEATPRQMWTAFFPDSRGVLRISNTRNRLTFVTRIDPPWIKFQKPKLQI